jgi:hypothetical protein
LPVGATEEVPPPDEGEDDAAEVPVPEETDGILAAGTWTEGAVTEDGRDGVVTDGVVTDGVFTKGVVTDGVVTDGLRTGGTVTVGVLIPGTETPATVEPGSVAALPGSESTASAASRIVPRAADVTREGSFMASITSPRSKTCAERTSPMSSDPSLAAQNFRCAMVPTRLEIRRQPELRRHILDIGLETSSMKRERLASVLRAQRSAEQCARSRAISLEAPRWQRDSARTAGCSPWL